MGKDFSFLFVLNLDIGPLGYISEYKGRTVNKQLEQLVKKCVEEFEREHGIIPPREDRDKL